MAEGAPQDKKIDWDKIELEPLNAAPVIPPTSAADDPTVATAQETVVRTFSPEEEKQLAAANRVLSELGMDITSESTYKQRIQNLMDLKLSDELKREAYRRMYLTGLQRAHGYQNVYAYVERNLRDHPHLFVPLSPDLVSPEEEHTAALKGIKAALQGQGDMRTVKTFMEKHSISGEEVHALGITLTPQSIRWAIVLPYGYEDVFEKLKDIFDLLQTPPEEARKLVKETALNLAGNYDGGYGQRGKAFIDGLKEHYAFSDSDAKEYVARYMKKSLFERNGLGDAPPRRRKSEVEAEIKGFGVNPESVLMREEFRKVEWAPERK